MVRKLKKKKKEMSIEEAERITGGLEIWGQTENFTPPKYKEGKDGKIYSDDLPKLPVVIKEQTHKGKRYDFVIYYPDGNVEGINVKSKQDKAKIDLQLSLDNLKKATVTGHTTVAMKILKKWSDETKKIKDAIVPKSVQEINKQLRNEQKALTGILGLKILEQFYDKPRSITSTTPKGSWGWGNTILTDGTINTIGGGLLSPEISGQPLKKGNWGNTILGRTYPPTPPVRPPKPQAHAREPLTGAGMRRFMEMMEIDNPVLIAKKYPKNQKALSISGFINLRFLCESMNVSVEDAFLYICEGMQKTNKRWLKHRIELEFFRGSISIVNLVNYFREKIEHNKSRHIGKYTLKQLYKSEYFSNFCQVNGIEFKSYTDFTRHFKRWKHHVEVLIDKKKPKDF